MRTHMILLFIMTTGCQKLDHIGQPPAFSEPSDMSFQATSTQLDTSSLRTHSNQQASLWSGQRGSLLGDRRAMDVGDILTVLIEIDDRAEISNSSSRQRSATEDLSVPNLLGIPQRNSSRLPEGASYENAIGINSSTRSSGDGSVQRKEKLTLRIAAAIVKRLPNGVLEILGRQEVRVNHELRELFVAGYVRPEDISRQNQITYDKIASARVSYGGRGDVSDVQQPRYGYQILDAIIPF